MDPQTPQERRAFESPLLGDPPPPDDRGAGRQRGLNTRWLALLALILLAAIVVLVVLI